MDLSLQDSGSDDHIEVLVATGSYRTAGRQQWHTFGVEPGRSSRQRSFECAYRLAQTVVQKAESVAQARGKGVQVLVAGLVKVSGVLALWYDPQRKGREGCKRHKAHKVLVLQHHAVLVLCPVLLLHSAWPTAAAGIGNGCVALPQALVECVLEDVPVGP